MLIINVLIDKDITWSMYSYYMHDHHQSVEITIDRYDGIVL